MVHVRFWPWWVESLPGTSNRDISQVMEASTCEVSGFFVASKVLVFFLCQVNTNKVENQVCHLSLLWRIWCILDNYLNRGRKKVVMLSMFNQNIGTWWTLVFHSTWDFNICLMQSVVPIGWVVLRDEQQDGDWAPTTLTRVTLIAMLSRVPSNHSWC